MVDFHWKEMDRLNLLPEFFQIAAMGNQDTEKLRGLVPQLSYIRVESAEEMSVISRATEKSKRKRARTFFEGIEYRARLPQGLHDRGEAFCFAGIPLDKSKNQARLESHFPAYVRLISIPEKIVEENTEWDVSVYPSEWNLDERIELYNIVNVGRLVLRKNASIVVKGNALVFTCGIVEKLAASEKLYDLGILPTNHGFGLRRGEFNGNRGSDGSEGTNGRDGNFPLIGRNFLGAVIPSGVTQEDLDGKSGSRGIAGSDGEAGLTGGACRIAEINIRSISGNLPFIVGVIAGNGGDGGDGGDGGKGGNGGNGAPAVKTYDGTWVGGVAGNGGDGGHGGTGGRAGHSGMSSHVFIDVAPEEECKLFFFSRSGKPGRPGRGGKSGIGGFAGKSDMNKAMSGKDGKAGEEGKPGRILPAARVYMNDIPYCSEEPVNSLGQKLNQSKDLQPAGPSTISTAVG